MRRAIVFLLIASLLPVAQAADPNRVDADISHDHPVNAIAIAGESDWLTTGINDFGGSAVGQDPNQQVWFLWTTQQSGAAWTQEQSGRADNSDQDPADLKTCGIPVLRDCVGHVVDVAIADESAGIGDGMRMVVASVNKEADHSILWYITQRGHIRDWAELDGEVITSIDMTSDASRIAVGTRLLADGTDPEGGKIHLFNWLSTSAAWDHTVASPVTDVSISDDGQRVTAAAEDHHRVTGAGLLSTEDLTDGDVLAVDAANDGTDYWSVAGFDSGVINLYNIESEGTSKAKLFTRPDSSPQNAVAIRDDGVLFMAGDDAGKVRLYVNVFEQFAQKQLIQTAGPLDGAVHDIAWSADGAYAAVSAGNALYFFRVTDNGLALYWEDAFEAPVTALAIDNAGDRVAAAVGNDVHMYEAVRTLSITGDKADLKLPLESQKTRVLTYANNGNRDAQFDLDITKPTGWTATAEPAQFSLAPGESQVVYFNVTSSANYPAGAETVTLAHGPGADEKLELVYDVIQKQFWEVIVAGSPSQGIDAGATAQFLMRITNKGNAPDAATLLATPREEGWTATINDPVVTEKATGEFHDFTVTVTAPDDAKELEIGNIAVGVAEGDDALLVLQAVVGAQFGVDARLTVDDESLRAGNQTNLRLTIINTGNAPDSYEALSVSVPTGWKLFFPDGQEPHTEFSIQAGASRTIPILVQVPATADPNNYQIGLRVTSLGDSSASVMKATLLSVEEVVEEKKDKDSPGLAPVLLLGALLVIARRRH